MKFKQSMLSSAMLVMKITSTQTLLCILCVYTLSAKEAITQRHFNSMVTSGVRNESLSNGLASNLETAFAKQDITITGIVKDAKGESLPGVSVRVKGSNSSTATDVNGKFTIRVPDNKAILVFTYVGFVTQEKSVGNSQTINVILKDSANELREVTITVGYGIQKKATSTGAQSSIDSKTLLQSPTANISNALVGRLSGVTGVQASGEPGNDQTTLRIRGVGTFAGSQDPLIMVDGIQVSLADFNRIDANEVENVTVLKDAASTAVYGIRGANGVMLVTTKSGKIGPATVSYSYNHALNSFTGLRENMSSYDYAVSRNRAVYNDAYITGNQATVSLPYSPEAIEKYRTGEDPLSYPNVDWLDLMFKKTSSQQQHNLNLRGGTQKAKYFISAGYFTQEGLFNNTSIAGGFDPQIKFNRYNFRSNLDFDVTKKMKMTFRLSSQTTTRKGPNIDTRTIIDNTFRANPTSSPGIYDDKLVILANGAPSENPLTSLFTSGYREAYGNTLNGSLRADHSLDFITKGLTTHGELAYQSFNENGTNYTRTPPMYRTIVRADGTTDIVPLADDQVLGGYLVTNDKNLRLTGEFAFDYKRTFGSHNVTGLLLYNQIRETNPSYTDRVASSYQSVVARTTYNYKQRYLTELNVAYNGSENFAPGKRFGLFPSYSLGWVPTEEAFFPKNKIVSFLKIRGSYGEVGNDRIGNDFLRSANRFLYRPTAFIRSGSYYTGLNTSGYEQMGKGNATREGRTSNPDLTWERSIKSNVGFEGFFFRDKVNFTFDLFKETRDNILADVNNIGGTFGRQAAPENFGKMENKGFEFDLGYKDSFKDFNYFIRGNFSFARNKILYMDEIGKAYQYQYRTNNSFGQFFGLIAEGYYNTWDEVNDANRPKYDWQRNLLQPGDVRYKDVNGDGMITVDDEVPIGFSNTPEITYGTTIGATFKGFDLSVLFQGAENVSVEYTRRTTQGFFDATPAAAINTLLESWTPERYEQGLPINYPRFTVGNGTTDKNNYRRSTLFVVDASYLRLKNIEIGYTLPANLFKRIGLKTTRFYITGNNLYTWKKMLDGIDPENPNPGANFEPYPLTKTFNFGASVNF